MNGIASFKAPARFNLARLEKTSRMPSRPERGHESWALHQKARRCSGISLIECVIYIAVLMVVLTLAFSALHRTWMTHYLLERNSQDIAAALQAGERWRADIRSAAGPIEAGETAAEWLLRIPSRRGPILYRLAKGTLRREISGQSSSLVLAEVKSCQMELDRRRQVTAWRWELELKSRTPKSRMHPYFTFIAVAPAIAP